MPTTTDEPTSTDDTAVLDILSRDPTEVRINGKPVGTTPIKGHKLPPGHYEVTFLFESNPGTQNVDLGPGEAKVVKLDPPPQIQEQQPKEDAPKKK